MVEAFNFRSRRVLGSVTFAAASVDEVTLFADYEDARRIEEVRQATAEPAHFQAIPLGYQVV